ncbi:helix-turn-helix domain-containing protein [Weissella cibaria]|uniref:helix-turn-helix domain-containing protein n=2 Tax=Weissella cibaria TaxID=137591 RepID=UPI001E2A858C|nr:helix-turn-helix transcriptional regulator [Weissella cibaria]MDK9677490.1 helix-turn-helix transcriptional regulator [Weissella cibaria]
MMDIVFAQQLTNLRKQKGLSQQQLADKLYMTRQAVSKWETGESSPDLNRMQEIADILDVSVQVLLFGTQVEPGKTSFRDKVSEYMQQDEADKDWHQNHRWRQWQYSPITNGWEFLARYYWLLFALIGMIGWCTLQYLK